MKAPLSDRIEKLLSNKSESNELMKALIKGERGENQVLSIDGRNYKLRRVARRILENK